MKLNTKTKYPNESYYKVDYSSNYADEFDVEGFLILSGKEVNDLVLSIKNIFKQGQFTHSIGTNECIEYSTMKELVDTLSVKKITVTQYKVLEDLNLLGSGMFPDMEDFTYEDDDSDAEDTFDIIEIRIKRRGSELSIDETYDPTSYFTLYYYDSKLGPCVSYEGYVTCMGLVLNSYIASIKELFMKRPVHKYGVIKYNSLEQLIDKISIVEISRSEYDTLEDAGMVYQGVFPMNYEFLRRVKG